MFQVSAGGIDNCLQVVLYRSRNALTSSWLAAADRARSIDLPILLATLRLRWRNLETYFFLSGAVSPFMARTQAAISRTLAWVGGQLAESSIRI
jgi:hypothetical protein